jgi:hypothetical protein
MLTRIIYAAAATLAIIGNTAQPAKAAIIISDAMYSSRCFGLSTFTTSPAITATTVVRACIGSSKFLSEKLNRQISLNSRHEIVTTGLGKKRMWRSWWAMSVHICAAGFAVASAYVRV